MVPSRASKKQVDALLSYPPHYLKSNIDIFNSLETTLEWWYSVETQLS